MKKLPMMKLKKKINEFNGHIEIVEGGQKINIFGIMVRFLVGINAMEMQIFSFLNGIKNLKTKHLLKLKEWQS
jgi:hypothetical protein